MERNFEYKKVCQFCGNIFTAAKSTTRYCSPTCANRAKKETDKLKFISDRSNILKQQRRAELSEKDYLSISQASTLLGISRPTIYKLIKDGKLQTQRISERITRIRRTELEQFSNNTSTTQSTETEDDKENLITKREALETYGISEAWFFKKLKSKNISPAIINGKGYYPAVTVKLLFSKKKYSDISEWYTTAQIAEKFGLTKQYIYEYTSEHRMPKKKQGKETLISKIHWDRSRGLDDSIASSYYTVPEITDRYQIGRSHIYDLIRIHNLPKIKQGNNILIHKEEFDHLMNNRKR
ncbi:MAG: helix-turn-helix domain-containing protein [Bacteroidales bacterium]|nr:helix-turn-helix domain-containing protein [Bacteroidales bacterium]